MLKILAQSLTIKEDRYREAQYSIEITRGYEDEQQIAFIGPKLSQKNKQSYAQIQFNQEININYKEFFLDPV